MTRFFPMLTGNEALRTRIGADIASESFSHAYILEGPSGSGKHTLAHAIAMAAACRDRSLPDTTLPCLSCPTCKKIAEGYCPDVILISRPEGRATMGVDTVRSIRESISLVPNDLDLKVYIIEDAHTMTVQAQNALLLTLEEPPPFVLFLLLAEDAGALLETVRSRAPVLRMQPIDRDTLHHYLTEQAPPAMRGAAAALLRDSAEEFAALLTLSDGRIGRALSLLDPKKRAPLMERRRIAEAVVERLSVRGGYDELLLTMLSLTQSREELSAQLTVLTSALSDLVLLTKSEGAPLSFFTDRERAAELSASFTTARLLRAITALNEAGEALLANANVKLTLTRLIERLIARSSKME